MNPTTREPAQDAALGMETEDARPRYEPPRITKRRSVARTTLFTGAQASGGGPGPQGLVTEGGTG